MKANVLENQHSRSEKTKKKKESLHFLYHNVLIPPHSTYRARVTNPDIKRTPPQVYNLRFLKYIDYYHPLYPHIQL